MIIDAGAEVSYNGRLKYVDQQDSNGSTPLVFALSLGHVHMTDMFLERSTNVKIANNYGNWHYNLQQHEATLKR